MYMQGFVHTGWEWSAPTTTQPLLHVPPLKANLPPLAVRKVLKYSYLMQFHNILAKPNHHSDHPGQNCVHLHVAVIYVVVC